MTLRPNVVGAIALAELQKLASRASVRLSALLLAVLAVGLPLGMMALTLLVQPTGDAVDAGFEGFFDLDSVLVWVLSARNFFVVRAMVIGVTAIAVAGEIVGRTLREDLVRAVSRLEVLTAKWLALQVFVLVCALLPFVLALPTGAILFGIEVDLGEHLAPWALSWLGDAGFATFVLALAVALRSVPGTIAGVFLYWVVDRFLGFCLWAVEQLKPMVEGQLRAWEMTELIQALDWAIAVRPWLPSAAFNVQWDYVPGEPLQWESFVMLGVLTAVSFVVAQVLFARTDVA